jgi:hypothetical protein
MTSNYNDNQRLYGNFKCGKKFMVFICHVYLGCKFLEQIRFYVLIHVCLNCDNLIFGKIH